MTEPLTIQELLNQHRLYCMSDESMYHLLSVIEFAGIEGILPQLTRALNYITPLPDEVIVLFRDGRHEERCFSWLKITKAEHAAELERHGVYLQFCNHWSPIVKDYTLPQRQFYHGGCIYRQNSKEWSIHT